MQKYASSLGIATSEKYLSYVGLGVKTVANETIVIELKQNPATTRGSVESAIENAVSAQLLANGSQGGNSGAAQTEVLEVAEVLLVLVEGIIHQVPADLYLLYQ